MLVLSSFSFSEPSLNSFLGLGMSWLGLVKSLMSLLAMTVGVVAHSCLFLFEVLLSLSWGLHEVALSQTAIARLEKEERRFLYLVCSWNNYAPIRHARSLPRPAPVSYSTFLKFSIHFEIG